MSSSNPFRKTTATKPPPIDPSLAFDTSAIPRASQPPPPVSFRHSSSSSPDPPAQPQEDPPPKKKKVVKKVRVLSPPPLSPDSPAWPDNKPSEDPFGGSDSTPADSGRATPRGNYDVWNDTWTAKGEGVPGEIMREKMEILEGEALKIGNGFGEKGGMDVGAFQRLLMTGEKGVSPDGAQDLPAQKIQDEPDADDDMSDSSMTVQFGQRKKAPPPPPSSRHGKSITSEPGEQPQPSEAGDSKKPAPLPPPRRGHSRTESKQQPTKDDAPHSPTRPHSNRQSIYAPAPPPPRRPHAAGRSQTSPTTTSFPVDASSPGATQEASSDVDASAPKISAPPPPPARNTSIRRPPSVSSVEAPSRQVSAENKRPPPPPARKKGSTDVPRTMDEGQEQEQGQGKAILSDLEALQREVDALRGKAGR